MLPRSVALSAFVLCAALPRSPAADWPQWLGPNRDGVWTETGLLDTFPKDGLKRVWTAKIGPGYTGPAVSGGKLLVMDRVSKTDAPANPHAPSNSAGSERVLCLDAATGKELWAHEYECEYKRISYNNGPRTTPVIDGDHVYTLGTMGDLRCLSLKDGKPVWTKNFIKDYEAPTPAWGWAAHLLVDGDKVVALVGGDKRAVMAFDKKTGAEKWAALTTREICYAPPVVVEAGGKRQLLVWVSEYLAALDPETGKEFWRHKHPPEGVEVQRPGVAIATPRVVGDAVFLSNYYHGAIAFKLATDKPAAAVLWRAKNSFPKKPDTLNTVMSSVLAHDGHLYGLCMQGEMKCLKADTGEVVWSDPTLLGGKPATFGSTSWVRNGDRAFCLTDTGDLCILKLSSKGYEEVSRTHLIDPTQAAGGRKVTWAHPAFADKRLYTRNDKEIFCVSLAKE